MMNNNLFNRILRVLESEALNSTLPADELYDHLYQLADDTVAYMTTEGREYDNLTIESVIDTRLSILDNVDHLAYDISKVNSELISYPEA